MTFHIAFYKGTQSGLIKGLYNRIVRWWDQSSYSHCELVFSDGMCGSSSFADGGVRLKRINLHPDKWDFIELPAHMEKAARQWFDDHNGQKYDLVGNVRFVIGWLKDAIKRWFCSEACGAACGIEQAWRLSPATLFVVMSTLSREHFNK